MMKYENIEVDIVVSNDADILCASFQIGADSGIVDYQGANGNNN